MKNIKIGQKLIVAFLMVAAIVVVLGLLLESKIEILDKRDSLMYDNGIVPLSLLITTVEHAQELRLNLRDWKLSRTPAERSQNLKEMIHAYKEVTEAVNKQIALVVKEESKQLLRKYQSAVDDYVKEVNKFAASAKNFTDEGVNLDPYPQALVEVAAEMERLLEENVTIKIKVTNEMSEESNEIAANAVKMALTAIPVATAFALLLGIFFTFSITSPLNVVVKTLSHMEKGDMTVRANLERGDELGKLARALDNLAEKLQGIFKGLRENSETLASSAEELSSVGRQVASVSEENVSISTTVASSAEQAATNINAMASGAEEASVNASDVASSAEQTSMNMNTIAAAIEEMSASISEISSNAGDASHIVHEATQKAHQATEVMGKLGAAAKEIGQVTDVIKKIADKTNLLALNATIEAASAGEAGKGFAVVAGEIKELANQSATSAEDIAQRVNGIQTGTGEAVEVIKDVSEIIGKVNHSVEAISSHVGQQTKASNEIASNVAQANTGSKRIASAIGEVAKGSRDIARNAGEAAKGASVVSQSVVGISQGAKDTAMGARQINQSSAELSKLASDLKNVLSQFKV
ncbi:MAG: methyl-accepting chemotaxis protein [Fibromonadaceae bacterium]|jgi:methyl-accepting chemotaxis protein|nr:methyl-accepting chemotaxis protein [Fibromonadaceae bacterium]